MKDDKIYLTIDDGPSEHTEEFLNVLKRYDSHATFFVIGEKIIGKEDIIKRMYDERHTIGVHGYSHDYKYVYQSCEAFWKDNLHARNMLNDITGKNPELMRFQGGSSNTVSRHYCKGRMTELTKQAASHGYRYFDWNICPNDTRGTKVSISELYDSIISELQSGCYDPPVILIHDLDHLTQNVELTERLLHDRISNGYRFAGIDNDTPVIHQIVEN